MPQEGDQSGAPMNRQLRWSRSPHLYTSHFEHIQGQHLEIKYNVIHALLDATPVLHIVQLPQRELVG